jgi:hypothetical protein
MDDVDPNQHPLVILLGAICWLLVSLVLYALQFTLVVGILLIPMVLLFVLLDALFELERIIPGWLLFGTMGGLPMLCALVFLERREEENSLRLILGRFYGTVSGSLRSYRERMRQHYERGQRKYSGDLGPQELDALTSAPEQLARLRNIRRLHMANLLVAIVSGPLLTWALLTQSHHFGLAFEDLAAGIMFGALPFFGGWFIWMSAAGVRMTAARLALQEAQGSNEVYTERSRAQAGSLTSAEGVGDGGELSIAADADGLTLVEQSQDP